MIYRKLGRTGLDVGVIGLGAQRLYKTKNGMINKVISEAVDSGVNYIDINIPDPDFRRDIGTALNSKRNNVILAAHLGYVSQSGHNFRSFKKELAVNSINDFFKQLNTDYIDVLMLHFVDTAADYKKVFGVEGLLEVALKMKKEGRTRFIGLSSHKADVSLAAVRSGCVDVLMFPVNPMFDALPGNLKLKEILDEKTYTDRHSLHGIPVSDRRELYFECMRNDIAVVAMKAYAAGWLLDKNNPTGLELSPIQCISYCLSQPGISTVVPGCSELNELRQALKYLESSEEEKDYSFVSTNALSMVPGRCMYCNHCLPCPENIDIGMLTKLTDSAGYGNTSNTIKQYDNLSYKASNCTKCGLCMKRCPFEVNVIENMIRAEKIFGR